MNDSPITFTVDAPTFCQLLTAVGLFQGIPREYAEYARVRCFVRHDGLTLLATNGVSGAIGHCSTETRDGSGLFDIPASQVKALLAVYKRQRPKESKFEEYHLEVSVTRDMVRVQDISDIFDREQLQIAVAPEALEPNEKGQEELAMSAAATMSRAVAARAPLDLADGVFFSPDEVARLARAAKALGVEIHVRPVGNVLLAPLAPGFTAYTTAQHHRDEPGGRGKGPFIDQRAVAAWSHRLDELVGQGVI